MRLECAKCWAAESRGVVDGVGARLQRAQHGVKLVLVRGLVQTAVQSTVSPSVHGHQTWTR
jgi:hypothetical protein